MTPGLRVRFAFENVLRLAGVMPRMRESSGAYIFETSTISFRLNRCRSCDGMRSRVVSRSAIRCTWEVK
jgi:hypothetical protein